MDALGSTFRTRVPSCKIGISLRQRLVPFHHLKLDYDEICSHGNITLPNLLRISKGLQCKCSLPETEVSVERKYGLGSAIRRKNLAVFVSGGGSNFRSIHNAASKGLIHGDVVVLVTNKPGCGGAEYARNHNIPIILFPGHKDSLEGLASSELVIQLRKLEVDFILLAGYLKLIPAQLVQAYPRSILNIHPSLLPAFGGKGFYGLKVHKSVIASGARYSGPTVHFVDEHYDTGCILAQKVVPVLANDTAEQLAARVLHEIRLNRAKKKCNTCRSLSRVARGGRERERIRGEMSTLIAPPIRAPPSLHPAISAGASSGGRAEPSPPRPTSSDGLPYILDYRGPAFVSTTSIIGRHFDEDERKPFDASNNRHPSVPTPFRTDALPPFP